MHKGEQRLLRQLFSEAAEAATALRTQEDRAARLESECQALKEQAQQSALSHTAVVTQLTSKLEQSTKRASELQRKCDQLSEQSRKLALKVSQLQKAAELQEAESKRLLLQTKELFSFDRKQLNARIAFLQAKQSQDKETDPLSFDKNRLLSQLSKLKNQNDYLNNLISNQKRKNEFLQASIQAQRRELDLAKGTEEEFGRRNSQLSAVVKSLTKKVKQLEERVAAKHISTIGSRQDSHKQASALLNSSQIKNDLQTRTLREQNQSLRKEVQFGKKLNLLAGKKYQNLGSLLCLYLNNLVQGDEFIPYQDILEQPANLTLQLHELRARPVEEWSREEVESIVHLLLTQVRPYLSKKSLLGMPDTKNINLIFVEEGGKEPINLPKIAKDRERLEQQPEDKPGRHKNLPVELTSKIVRSQLRDWGRNKAASERRK